MSNRSIGKQISEISRNLSKYLDIKTSHLGLTSATIPFMGYLFTKDGVHQEELAENLHFDKSSATRAITALEKLGYVKRVTDENNKRRNIIYVTDRAADVKAELFSILGQLTVDIYEGFTEDEKDIYFECTGKINDNLLKMLDKN